MSSYSNKLTEMVNNSEDQASALDDSTAQLIVQIHELESQRDSIQYGLLDKIATDMSGYLELIKLPLYGGSYIVFGATYNISTVLDWIIYDSTAVPVYQFGGVGWDGDTTILELESKWQFGYDYIIHPYDLTGTYGLQARIDQLTNGLNLLILNKTKIEGTATNFKGYAD